MTNIELKEIRKGLGFSQWVMATKLGMSQAYYSVYELGYKPVSDKIEDKVKRICDDDR